MSSSVPMLFIDERNHLRYLKRSYEGVTVLHGLHIPLMYKQRLQLGRRNQSNFKLTSAGIFRQSLLPPYVMADDLILWYNRRYDNISQIPLIDLDQYLFLASTYMHAPLDQYETEKMQTPRMLRGLDMFRSAEAEHQMFVIDTLFSKYEITEEQLREVYPDD